MSKYRYPILAKPSGVTLDEHRQHVMSEGALLVNSMPFAKQKYQQLTNKELLRRVELVCQFHDEGKELSEKWQNACQQDYEDYQNWLLNNKGKSFRDYAQKEDAGKNIRKAGVRHEFYSLLKKKTLPLVLQAAIAAHHGKLNEQFEDRWLNEGFKEYWKKFKIESYKERTLKETAEFHYEFAGIRGLLQLADHRASAEEDGMSVPNITSFRYQFPHSEKRGVQKLIEQHWNEDLLLVRAPTGAGKTDASLLWAKMQIENNRAERLIIAMPTRFTSNALAINVAESLSDTGLYHSSAWFTKFKSQVEEGLIKKKDADKIHEFARLLQTPITVCTIDHLLMALTLTREDHHLISFNMANACLVIDEADFYDDFTQANILVLLEILRYWKVPVLLMSASLPESVLPKYQKIGYQISQILEDNSDNFRERFEIKFIQSYSDISEIDDVLNLCVEKETAIIYANTVDKAIAFYNWFQERNANPILYHSRFTEPDKKDKEEELIDALGKDAWIGGKAKGIAILTQIGEMSINISADIMITELCPIDRLTQRAGRLCRFDKSKTGSLYVLIPHKNGELYPAPYGEYNRREKKWMPCEAFTKTSEILEKDKYNANNLRDYFKYNWLINPMQVTSIDDSETNYWRSRDIAAQDTVFVEKPEFNYFNNYLSFQNWKLSYSLELPVYLIERGKKLHMIDVCTITIQDNENSIYVIREGFYSKAKGVTFIEEDCCL